jgi:phospholipid/cholesterol/gamma-HCH transport system permease protein
VSEPAFNLEREATAEGGVVLHLVGRCRLAEAPALLTQLAEHSSPEEEVALDLSELLSLDGASAALLLNWSRDSTAHLGRVEFLGTRPECEVMFGLYCCDSEEECSGASPAKIGTFDQIGRATVDILCSGRDVLSFVGDLVASARQAFHDRRSVNWREVPQLMERAGADGVPIVLLINFLVGLIIGLQSAYQLQKFGADIFIADLVGLSMARELAPLMTAIVVAGRSGAAYAAELGTMKVNQEIDALWTLGFNPHHHLVFPRLIAMAAVVPLLTLGSVLVGIIGGLIIAVSTLDLTPLAYFTQLESAVGLLDILGGLFKSMIFAVTITLISCQRGLATAGGAAGVGRSTTSAVVIILFGLVVLDAIFTVTFNFLGI